MKKLVAVKFMIIDGDLLNDVLLPMLQKANIGPGLVVLKSLTSNAALAT